MNLVWFVRAIDLYMESLFEFWSDCYNIYLVFSDSNKMFATVWNSTIDSKEALSYDTAAMWTHPKTLSLFTTLAFDSPLDILQGQLHVIRWYFVLLTMFACICFVISAVTQKKTWTL